MPNEIKIKSNGLRNELKEIRKSIDSLTNAIIAQTHARYEKSSNNGCLNCNCKNDVLQNDV